MLFSLPRERKKHAAQGRASSAVLRCTQLLLAPCQITLQKPASKNNRATRTLRRYVAVLICLLPPRNLAWHYVDKSRGSSLQRKNQPNFRVQGHFLRGRQKPMAVPRNRSQKNSKTSHFLRGEEGQARYST